MNLIVAVTENWGIGNHGKLLCSVKEDMQFFRRMTMGKTVIMGRKTLESFPGGKPLKNRENLVLSRDPQYVPEGVRTFHSVEALLSGIGAQSSEDVFVIGGAEIYRQLLPYCKTAYVTKLGIIREADSYFPNLDTLPEWKQSGAGEVKTDGEVSYQFTTYENLSAMPLPKHP